MRHEGLRLRPYVDTTGHLTIGYGHNLTDCGISPAIARAILDEDLGIALADAAKAMPWLEGLDDTRKRAFVELWFNLGEHLLGFHGAQEAAQQGLWDDCASELRHSKWHDQVGHRAVEIEQMIRTGTDVA